MGLESVYLLRSMRIFVCKYYGGIGHRVGQIDGDACSFRGEMKKISDYKLPLLRFLAGSVRSQIDNGMYRWVYLDGPTWKGIARR